MQEAQEAQNVEAQNVEATSAKEQELSALQAEIDQLEASLESNGAEFLANHLSEADEELFFENPKEFFKKQLENLNTFYAENIASKKQKAKELEEGIAQEAREAEYSNAYAEFSKAHPSVDVEMLVEFVQEDLSPRVQKELNALPSKEALEKALEYYNAQTKGEAHKLPKQLKGGEIPADEVESNSSESYFERI